MRKNQVLILLSLSCTLLLYGCAKSPESVQVNVESIEQETPEVEVPVSDTSEADVPPTEGMVRSRLTNEWIDEQINNTRPIAVMIPNSSTASHFGLSKADVLYEVNVEGDMTRLMAIINDWQDMDKIGNIRSCRDYFVYWSFEWDAIYIHYGGPFYMYDVIGRNDTDNIDCISQPDIGKYNNDYTDLVFRDAARNDTDNAFTKGSTIKEACEELGISLEYRDNYADSNHFVFAPFDKPNTLNDISTAFKASKLDMSNAYPMTNCYFIYNEETGNYDRYQHLTNGADEPHVDLADNTQLSFKNIIVQNAYYEVRDKKGYLAFQCIDSERDGWYFTNGKGIHVNWEKKSDYGATRYYDDNGNEINLNTGKTMICIIKDGDTIIIDDKEYTSGNS